MARVQAVLKDFYRHPVDVVEQVMSSIALPFERCGEDDLAAEYAGRWCAYQLWFAYRPDIEGLHFSCSFDMRVPRQMRERLFPLLAQINERLWLGHFDLWLDEGQPAFRHAMLFRGGEPPVAGQIEHIIETAITECERFYPAFQHVLWAGKSASEAIADAVFETAGEA
ncbi:MAG: hypothetical protein FJX66_03380 [Alphaproteobacteria bacterium]|nr:hypothetical protein [Alphaproteobacteria bacterium]